MYPTVFIPGFLGRRSEDKEVRAKQEWQEQGPWVRRIKKKTQQDGGYGSTAMLCSFYTYICPLYPSDLPLICANKLTFHNPFMCPNHAVLELCKKGLYLCWNNHYSNKKKCLEGFNGLRNNDCRWAVCNSRCYFYWINQPAFFHTMLKTGKVFSWTLSSLWISLNIEKKRWIRLYSSSCIYLSQW